MRASGRLEGRDGVGVVLAAAAIWWLAAGTVMARAAAQRAWPVLLALAPHAELMWALAAAAGLVALLCFAVLGSISVPALALAALVAAAATAVSQRRLPAVARGWRLAADLVVLALVLAVVPDLVIFPLESAGTDAGAAIEVEIFQFHQNLLLGPANEVLHGHPMLVGTASQYGVTSIYSIAAWFQVAPVGYGTFGLLTGAMTAVWYAAGYGILRLARTPRLLSAAALALAVVALVFNLTFPVGALPQSGPLRFGMPMAIVLAAVAAERFPRHGRAARLVGLGFVGLAAVWSLEALAYTAIVFAALAGLRAWLSPAPGRLRTLGRDAIAAALAIVLAHALFAAITLAASGELPDWGAYIDYLREFLLGDLGDLTYDVPRWTPGLAVGIGYAASAVAIAELARRRGPLVERERPALVAITGVTAYGIALLSYYVDRSQDHILMHVSLPAVLTGALWLALLLRADAVVSRRARTAGLAFALAVSVLVAAVAWNGVGARFPHTALGLAAPGGDSLHGALDRLWHLPPLARGRRPANARWRGTCRASARAWWSRHPTSASRSSSAAAASTGCSSATRGRRASWARRWARLSPAGSTRCAPASACCSTNRRGTCWRACEPTRRSIP